MLPSLRKIPWVVTRAKCGCLVNRFLSILDRELLNALCNRILHLEDGRLTDFPGGYDAYQRELERRRAHQQFEYDQYRAERPEGTEACTETGFLRYPGIPVAADDHVRTDASVRFPV